MRSLFTFRIPLWFVMPLLAVLSVAMLAIGYYAATRLSTPCPLAAEDCQKLNRLYAAWDLIKENYVDPEAANTDALVDGAITGLVDSLGDKGHSRYMSPKDAAQEREALDGTFEGIGAYLSEREGYVIIAAPIEGAPAEKAGVLPGDRILTVDGVDMKSATISELQSKVRGPSGTTVVLEILHESGETETISIVRQSIDIPSVTWSMLPGNVAHIHLNQFSAQANDDMRTAVRAAQAGGATAIILDLRNNPGGYVDQLMSVAGQFLPTDSTQGATVSDDDSIGASSTIDASPTEITQTPVPVQPLKDNLNAMRQIRRKLIGQKSYRNDDTWYNVPQPQQLTDRLKALTPSRLRTRATWQGTPPPRVISNDEAMALITKAMGKATTIAQDAL